MNANLIFLIGFMGSGKTYIGKLLATKMDYPFFDLDEYVEEKCSMKIPKIFEEKGEDYFRIEERKCLRDFGVLGDAIVSAGGGTPCFYDNMEWMNENGVTIYLETEPELLAQRLIKEKSKRPLIANIEENKLLDFITQKLEERTEFYNKASIIIKQEKEMEGIVELIFENYLSLRGQ